VTGQQLPTPRAPHGRSRREGVAKHAPKGDFAQPQARVFSLDLAKGANTLVLHTVCSRSSIAPTRLEEFRQHRTALALEYARQHFRSVVQLRVSQQVTD
jgi:hypothetical protein